MTKTAWVFPGQGSQKIGMGLDLIDFPNAKAKYEAAEKILGWSVPAICQSDENTLSQTIYTQPSLYVVESILIDLMRAKGHQPALVAGHSLGEYVALYAAGVLDFEAGLSLVKNRSELMAQVSGGQMAALIGFKREQLESEIQANPDVVIANDNSDTQVVISGKQEAVEAVLSKIKVKLAVKLNVSGAFHSHFMESAATEFQKVLNSMEFKPAHIPVLSNVEPEPTTDPEVIKSRLSRQMTHGVRWREIMLKFPQEGIEKIIEIGPGNVLTGLLKRTCPKITLENVSQSEHLAK